MLYEREAELVNAQQILHGADVLHHIGAALQNVLRVDGYAHVAVQPVMQQQHQQVLDELEVQLLLRGAAVEGYVLTDGEDQHM